MSYLFCIVELARWVINNGIGLFNFITMFPMLSFLPIHLAYHFGGDICLLTWGCPFAGEGCACWLICHTKSACSLHSIQQSSNMVTCFAQSNKKSMYVNIRLLLLRKENILII